MDITATKGYIGAILDTATSIQITTLTRVKDEYRPRITLMVANESSARLIAKFLKDNAVGYRVQSQVRKRHTQYTHFSIIIARKNDVETFLNLLENYHLLQAKTKVMRTFLAAGKDIELKRAAFTKLKELNGTASRKTHARSDKVQKQVGD